MRILTTRDRRVLRSHLVALLADQDRDRAFRAIQDLVLLDDTELAVALDTYRKTIITRAEEQIKALETRLQEVRRDLAALRDSDA